MRFSVAAPSYNYHWLEMTSIEGLITVGCGELCVVFKELEALNESKTAFFDILENSSADLFWLKNQHSLRFEFEFIW